MSHVVTLEEVNQFLPESLRVTLHSDIEELEDSQAADVFARLKPEYDVTAWTSPTTIPYAVRNVISLLIAGRIYTRQYSEGSTQAATYGERRLSEARRMLANIEDGDLDIGVDPATGLQEPSYYDTGDPVFEMGARF